MPALAPVPGVLKYRFMHHVGTDTNVGSHLYFRTVTSPTQAQIQSAADAAHNAWVTNFAPLCSTSNGLNQVIVMDLSSPSSPLGVNTTAAAGTLGGLPNPASTCCLLNIPVPRRYRGGKPRVYWPLGSGAELASPQAWVGTFVTSLNSAWVALGTAITSNLTTWAPSAGLVSVSYYLGGEWKPDQNGNYHRVPTPRATPLVDVVVGTAAFSATPSTQRRRLRPS